MSWIREPNAEPIPGYRLIEPLGSGGFGEVWKCEAPGGIYKAIKFVFGNLNSLDVDCVRAEQELRALHRIKEVRHPFVCSLDRIEVVEGELVIVMELAERTLHDVFQDCISSGLIGIPRDNLLRYLADASEALDHMNEKHNLQHLDIKPKNLFLIGDRAKVADFGLVKHLERQGSSGMLGGVTPLYAAPETYHGKISHHSDQYSLAIVYQELLTGQRPFNGKNVRQLAQQHLKEKPDVRSLPESDRRIVERALAKDPAQRFPNCVAFLSALYRARLPARVVENVAQAVHAGAAEKPGTMRDIQLEAYDDLRSSAEIDLNALPRAELGEDQSLVSDMGVTQAQPDSGALRPTLLIGVGAFGRKALLELRCRFMDRFGDLAKVPVLRFLYLDPDPEAATNAVRGAPEVALTRNEIYPLPLQPVVKYRQRNLDQMSEWLPREKLFAMPRSLQTQGSRALGRLAFADNQQRLLARIRREILEITNPDIIYQSVTQTGLALRDTTPRIYVLAAAGGGSSGMLPDLGYAIRRLLGQLRHPDAPVNVFLLAGAPQDPASPKPELANIFATLTELNHFSDPTIGFFAQYGTEGQRIVDQGPPFHATYLLPQHHRTPEALEQTVSHLGNYLFHELTTPLGLRLDNLRRDQDFGSGMLHGVLEARFRSMGTFAVWFPRGLLLRLAARHACRRLIDGWLAEGDSQLSPEARQTVDVFLEKVSLLPMLQPEQLGGTIEANAQAGTPTDTGTAPGEVLAGMLVRLEEQILQPVAQEDPGNWARQALTRIREWVGAGEAEEVLHDWRKTRVSRTLLASAQQVAEKLDQELAVELFGLMNLPGARVAAAEWALKQVHSFCLRSAEEQKKKIQEHTLACIQAMKALEQALEDCLTGNGGFRLFGGRSRSRNLRRFMDCLAAYARHRLAEEVAVAVRQCFAMLAGKLNDRGRDVGFCRQRLRHLQECLESGPADSEEELASTLPGADFTLSRSPLPSTEAYWEAIRQSATARVVLPDGETDLERAALRFLQSLRPEHWDQLDREIHERVLVPRGGLQGASLTGGDVARQLAQPLLEEAGELLGGNLPIMDVAQILMEEASHTGNGSGGELTDRIREYLDRAAPLMAGKLDQRHQAFLLVPGSPAGRALGEAVTLQFPQIAQVRVAGQSDLMLCREQGSLTAADLHAVLTNCRAAYESMAHSPAVSPHARFDISDWVPIDP